MKMMNIITHMYITIGQVWSLSYLGFCWKANVFRAMSLNNVTTEITNIANKGKVQSWPAGNSVLTEIAPGEVKKQEIYIVKALWN